MDGELDVQGFNMMRIGTLEIFVGEYQVLLGSQISDHHLELRGVDILQDTRLSQDILKDLFVNGGCV